MEDLEERKKYKGFVDVITRKMSEGTDYLRGAFALISLLTIFGAPFFINLILLLLDGDTVNRMMFGKGWLTED